MTRSKNRSYRIGRIIAGSLLVMLLWAHFPVAELQSARDARGFITLTGQHMLNLDVFLASMNAAMAWGGVLSICILYLGRSRFRVADISFLVGLLAVITAGYLWLLAQDLPSVGGFAINMAIALFVPVACYGWLRRTRIGASLIRLRVRNPITMASA